MRDLALVMESGVWVGQGHCVAAAPTESVGCDVDIPPEEGAWSLWEGMFFAMPCARTVHGLEYSRSLRDLNK